MPFPRPQKIIIPSDLTKCFPPQKTAPNPNIHPLRPPQRRPPPPRLALPPALAPRDHVLADAPAPVLPPPQGLLPAPARYVPQRPGHAEFQSGAARRAPRRPLDVHPRRGERRAAHQGRVCASLGPAEPACCCCWGCGGVAGFWRCWGWRGSDTGARRRCRWRCR